MMDLSNMMQIYCISLKDDGYKDVISKLINHGPSTLASTLLGVAGGNLVFVGHNHTPTVWIFTKDIIMCMSTREILFQAMHGMTY